MKKHVKFPILIGLVMISIIITQFISPLLSESVAQENIQTQVLYLGEGGNVLDGLELDEESLDVTTQTSESIDLSTLDDYDMVVINDVNLSLVQVDILYNWSKIEHHGLMIIMGPELTQGNQLLSTYEFSSQTHFRNNTGYILENETINAYKGLSIINEEAAKSGYPLIDTIVWNTAPETFYFTKVEPQKGQYIPMIDMQWNGNFSKTDYPLIAGQSVGANLGPNVYLLTGWFQEDFDSIDANEHFMLWPYFNYLMFLTTQTATGHIIPSYGSWAYSPVPHLRDQIILGAVVLVMGIGSVIAYVVVRKHKKTHRKEFATTQIFKEKGMDVEFASEEILEETGLEEEILIDEEDHWEKIGFHRQISGFFKLFFVMIMLLIPQLLVTSIVMPRFLNPYPQASGWYSYTLRFFEAIWLVFDMGFNFAITKYFAQHRIEKPEKAYHYVQLFVWWEILSGVLQIFLIAFLGSIIFPMTNFNYLSWMFVIHSLIQFPGFFLVFQYFFQGNQRADMHMIAFALQFFVLRLVLQVGTVPLFRWIYADNVMYGPAFGCGIGLLVGQLLGDWALFFITLKMYKNLDLPLLPIFTADFTKEEFVETFKFGGKMILGQMWVPLVWLLQVYLVGVFLPNSAAEQGFFELAFTVSTIPQAVALLMGSMMGALSEAHEYDKKDLLNYTSFSGIKWGSIWTFYLTATFWAIGKEFIIGASGPNWARAGALIPMLMIYRALGPFSWQMDYEFAAADKPGYAGIAWVLEQSVRAVLLYVLLRNMEKMEAVVYAYIAAIATKTVVVIILTRWKIHKWDWNLWQSFVAPILAAVVNFFILRLFVFIFIDLLFGEGIISAMILFVIGMFIMEHVYSFFVGLFGGYDNNTLEELNLATDMVTGVRGLARIYYKAAKLGASISPLHNKFKVEIFEPAMKEAEELTKIKKKIVLNNHKK